MTAPAKPGTADHGMAAASQPGRLSNTQLRTEEREHIRVELLVEGTAVKAGRICA